jgi:phosphatidylserine/phosphatidylglycerophosphate/cardiolipin synthase-like enzyme
VHFGGPDLPRAALRDGLEARIDAVPAGGSIAWATYYFRDQVLAQALLRAKHRGVNVSLVLEGHPRESDANDPVFTLLGNGDGLGSGLHRFARPSWLPKSSTKSHLHCKIYAFSHPTPTVLVGSFNPSGNGADDDAQLIVSIGDQDAGHNLLVEHHEPEFVTAMFEHIARLPRLSWSPVMRFLPQHQFEIRADGMRAWLFPRNRRGIVERLLRDVGANHRVRVAMSHLKSDRGIRILCNVAKRGAKVDVVLHHTERRAPVAAQATLAEAGIRVYRYHRQDELPMHAKFMLIDTQPGASEGSGDSKFATYGSLNLNKRSLKLNHEVFVANEDPGVFAQLERRWQIIEAECREQAAAVTGPAPTRHLD